MFTRNLLFFCFAVLLFLTACSQSAGSNRVETLLPTYQQAVSSSPVPAGTTTPEPAMIRVLWTINQYKLGTSASLSQSQAEAYLFKPLDMDASSITFDGKVCRNISFIKEKVSTVDYLQRTYQITQTELGIADPQIEVIKTDCDLPGFQEFLRLADRRLIIVIGGIFFFFEPAVTY